MLLDFRMTQEIEVNNTQSFQVYNTQTITEETDNN